MCLTITRNCYHKPEYDVPVCKRVVFHATAIVTPYTERWMQFGDGYFYAKDSGDDSVCWKRGGLVCGGWLHAGTSRLDECTTRLSSNWNTNLSAMAYGVRAYGDANDLVCDLLYIPALDLRRYSVDEIRWLRRQFPGSFGAHTKAVMCALDLGNSR